MITCELGPKSMSGQRIEVAGHETDGASVVLDRLAGHIGAYAYRYSNELMLHTAIDGVLLAAGERGFVREYPIDKQNRFDFWLPAEGVVIEVKVDGSLAQALRQCDRYARLESVRAVLLVHPARWGTVSVDALQGVPFASCALRRASL